MRRSIPILVALFSLLSLSCSAHRDERLADSRLGCTTGADCGTGICVGGQCVESSSASVRAIGRADGADVTIEHQIIGDEVCTPGKQTICTLKPGSMVIWRAPHVDGFRFAGWSGDPGCTSDQPMLTLQVQQDITCTAHYVRRLHGAGAVADGQGSVSAVSASPFASCQDGSCEVDQGSEIMLTAPARDGLRLTSWQGAGCPSGSSATISITPTVADVACSAVYTPSLTVHGIAQGAMASIAASSDSPAAACNADLCAVEPGAAVTLTAPAVQGFRFTGWSGDANCSSNNAQVSIANVTSNVSCTANYVARYAVTGASAGATTPLPISAMSADAFASCMGATCEVDDGGSVKLIAPTVSGLRLSGWDGDGCTTGDGASASVSPVHEGHTCTAKYVAGVAVIGTLVGVASDSGASVDASSSSAGANCGAGRCAIDVGGSVTLTAPDLPGRTFLGWTGDDGCAGDARVLTLSAVNTSKSCNASFAARFTAGGNSAPADAGSVAAASPAANASCAGNSCTVDDGSAVVLSAAAKPGFRFAGFSGGGACTGSAAVLTLDAVHNNIACTANFVQRFDVTSEVAPTGSGSALVSSLSTAASCNGTGCAVDAGADAAVFAVPASGYRFTGWSGCASNSDNPLLVANVRQDQHCRANFARIMLDVNALASAGGSVSGTVGGVGCDNAACSVPFGESVAFSATPANGYTFAGWSDCVTSAERDITLTGVMTAQTCRATFTRIQLSVTATTTDGGSISATSSSGSCANYRCSVEFGGTVMLTATPVDGFRFVGWDGCSNATGAALTLSGIMSNATCNATFTRMQFTVHSSVAPADSGSVACSSTGCGVAYDGGVTLTAKPAEGYVFARWSGCSTSTNATLALANVKSDLTCVANFDHIRVAVTSSVAPANSGSVSCSVAGCTVDYGGSLTLTATPAGSYRFTNWSGCSSSTNATLMLTNLKAASNCVANFALLQHTVTGSVAASGGGTVTCAAGCLVDDNSTGQLRATPATNFAFASWSCTPAVTESAATLSIPSVKQDYACVATFRRTAYTVTATADAGYTPGDSYGGVPCPNNICTVAPNGTVQLTVTAPVKPAGSQTTLIGWDGCRMGPTTVALVNGTFVYTSSVSNVNANLTCNAQFAPAAFVQSFAGQGGTVAVSTISGGGWCGTVDASTSYCFVLPGNTATFTATPDTRNSFYLSQWSCSNLPVTTVNPTNQQLNNPLTTGGLSGGISGACNANFSQIILE